MSKYINQHSQVPVNLSVRLIPDLSAAAFKTHTDKELALWYALRAINFTHSGCVNQDEAIFWLKELMFSYRTIMRTLKAGEGRFWSMFEGDRGPTIEIYGIKRVYEGYSTYPFNVCRFYEVEPDRFNSLKKRRLAMWESLHKPHGVKANPISRKSLEDYTGVHERTQQRYDDESRVKTTAAWRPGYTDSTGKPMDRMANIYHNRQSPGHIGQLRKVRHALKSFKTDGAIEKRRYFPSGRSMLRTANRENPCYILTRSHRRQIWGRIEYRAELTLC